MPHLRPSSFRGGAFLSSRKQTVPFFSPLRKAEILDIDGNVLEGYSADRCIPVSDDSTIRSIRWKGKKNLADIAGMPVRFRFYITGGDLYSFWVSPSENGESNGYSAAGGPGFTGSTDTEGIRAYKVAEPYNRLIEELDSKN